MTARDDLGLALDLLVLKGVVERHISDSTAIAPVLERAAQRLTQIAVAADPALAALIAAHKDSQDSSNVIPFPVPVRG